MAIAEIIPNLSEIEYEIGNILMTDNKSWVRLYRLFKIVEREELWKDEYHSISSWVNHVARKTKSHACLIWKRKSAGEFYEEYERRKRAKGEPATPLDEIQISPDNFILIKKIAQENIQTADEMTDEVVRGVLGRKRLIELWTAIRAVKASQGIPFTKHNSHGTLATNGRVYSDLIDRRGHMVLRGIYPDNRKLISAEDILVAFGTPRWLEHIGGFFSAKTNSTEKRAYKQFPEFKIENRATGYSRILNMLIIENCTVPDPRDVVIHGIEVKVNESDFVDLMLEPFTPYVDYMWIAVPEMLVESAKQLLEDDWGIIAFGNNKVGRIVKKAAGIPNALRVETLQAAIIKMI